MIVNDFSLKNFSAEKFFLCLKTSILHWFFLHLQKILYRDFFSVEKSAFNPLVNRVKTKQKWQNWQKMNQNTQKNEKS